MNTTAPFALAYTFDYARFYKPDLQNKAKSTLGNFLGFVRKTFDGLLGSGKALWDLYYDCIAHCPNGKKVFEQWLISDDFGSSRYFAKSAMEIYAWFEKLPSRMQRLICQHVQKWSVSALRQLTKVSHDLVKELVRNGKKTAPQVKKLREQGVKSTEENSSLNEQPTPAVELNPGMRIVVKSDDRGWSGYSGIIMSQWNNDFWVLLDHTVSQGMEVKHLFKPHQIQPEALHTVIKPASPKHMFTPAEVEQKIAEALTQRKKEKAEEELGRFVEIRDAALKAAKEEIIAAQKHATKMEQAKHELIEQLIAKENELQSVKGLIDKNKQLQQRVKDLEKALEDSNKDSWGNTFNKQAAKVVNKELEKTIEPLTLEVERLNNVLLQKEQQLTQLQAHSRKQREELQQKSKSNSVIAEFGSIGEYFGWNGWSEAGYRTKSGTLYTGIHALTAFICDLKVSHPNYQEQEIPF
ncbi:MAG: hypothetical protein HC907_17950 [Richelia sp. SM1_7_0]|nr:hypothetical protein [Richelia sp. SM1_7_0]